MSNPRAAVYNRHWPSQGGGERHAGMVAQVLAEDGFDVELIGHDDVDLSALAEHLGLDLSRCRLRVVDDIGESALSELTAEYDLFVNGSYTSVMVSQATHALYLCYFPTPADHDLPTWMRRVAQVIGPHLPPIPESARIRWEKGWFPPEGGRRRQWIWSNGDGRLSIAPGPAAQIDFDLGRPGQDPAELTVTANGSELLSATAGGGFQRHVLVIPAADETRELHFRSSTFVPGAQDKRQLGVALSRIRMSGVGVGPAAHVSMRWPWLLRGAADHGFVDSYDVVVANSHYTAGWIEHYWQRAAEVLYPPVQVERLHPSPERDRTIVAVGRFFPPTEGHCKRQLELVQTFGRMVRSGVLQGWTLQLIGGSESRTARYLDEVRAAATGLPVEIHANAPRPELEAMLSRASVQWAATGYGVKEDRQPWTSEHFGMTTVESMASGCVPIVIDKAGQREIVRDGVDGFRWSTLEELIQRTLQVARDDALRARLARSAMERAQLFSDATFARGLRDTLTRHGMR